MTADLLIIVPTRGRPEAVQKVVDAWGRTGAFEEGAELLFAIDYDDGRYGAYLEAVAPYLLHGVRTHTIPAWMPMVGKLNAAARVLAREHFAVGFAGDDHIPRTEGWVTRYLAELRDLRAGVVYGDDGFQGERLPTQWAMTSDIVNALEAMVPGGVEHMYCDNIIRDLASEAECLKYVPDVLIEHMHPAAGKAEEDDGYLAVNAPAQYRRDQRAYAQWIMFARQEDVATVRALRE